MLGQCHNSYELFFCKLRLCLFINAVSLDYFLLTHSHEMLINMKKKNTPFSYIRQITCNLNS